MTAARWENPFGAFIVALLLLLMALTIFSIPYDQAEGRMRVNVVAQQFGWNLKPAMVPAKTPITFSVQSRDVQHGFGVYDGTELLFQVQVPAKGKTQEIVHTFEKAGTYDILCLEFCGFQHHAMRGTIKVVD